MNKTLIGLGNQEIFSKNLSRYVKESGKTQMEIAKAVGISRGTFCDYVKGRAYPRMDKVQKLSEYFGIKISDLVDERPSEEDLVFASQKEEVLELFSKVPEEKRELVLSLIRVTIENLESLR
jgi:transcriptional regulator with XRE-family HTH domain